MRAARGFLRRVNPVYGVFKKSRVKNWDEVIKPSLKQKMRGKLILSNLFFTLSDPWRLGTGVITAFFSNIKQVFY
jgi:hypothetical protein